MQGSSGAGGAIAGVVRRPADGGSPTVEVAGGARPCLDAQLPDRLHARRGVGAAERDVEQFGVLDVGDFAIPDVEIDNGVACAGVARGSGARQEGLVEVGEVFFREGLDLNAVDVEAAGRDRQVGRRAGDQGRCRRRPG